MVISSNAALERPFGADSTNEMYTQHQKRFWFPKNILDEQQMATTPTAPSPNESLSKETALTWQPAQRLQHQTSDHR
jgi:hypothetical protein